MLVRFVLSCEVFLSLPFFSHYEEERRIDCFRLSMFRAFIYQARDVAFHPLTSVVFTSDSLSQKIRYPNVATVRNGSNQLVQDLLKSFYTLDDNVAQSMPDQVTMKSHADCLRA